MSRMRANEHSGSVQRVASAAGSHFFDRDAMRFFGSRVLGDAWRVGDVWLFVTSERFRGYGEPDGERRYTVRVYKRGSMGDIGGFQQFASAYAAKRAASRAAHLLSVLG